MLSPRKPVSHHVLKDINPFDSSHLRFPSSFSFRRMLGSSMCYIFAIHTRIRLFQGKCTGGVIVAPKFCVVDVVFDECTLFCVLSLVFGIRCLMSCGS